jgi:hypothetical protein
LQWSWNHATDEIWRELDPGLWDITNNPWAVLQTASRDKIGEVLGAPLFERESGYAFTAAWRRRRAQRTITRCESCRVSAVRLFRLRRLKSCGNAVEKQAGEVKFNAGANPADVAAARKQESRPAARDCSTGCCWDRLGRRFCTRRPARSGLAPIPLRCNPGCNQRKQTFRSVAFSARSS